MAWHKGSWWPLFVPQWYSPNVSQHPFDPYSFTHILHGLIFFLLFYPLGYNLFSGLLLVFTLEFFWETLENRPSVIQKYRLTSGTSPDYNGDSYQNILGDLLACTFGYLISWMFQEMGVWWVSLIWLLVSEVGCLLYMRDCLILTFFTLVVPEALVPKANIMQWQEEGVNNARRGCGLSEDCGFGLFKLGIWPIFGCRFGDLDQKNL